METAFFAAAVALFFGSAGWVLGKKNRPLQVVDSSPPEPRNLPYDDSELRLAIAEITAVVENAWVTQDDVNSSFTIALSDGINHVDRAEKRVRSVVTAAQRRMDKAGYVDPGIEAEATQLPREHEGISGAEGVRVMPDSVDDDGLAPSPWDAVPGLIHGLSPVDHGA